MELTFDQAIELLEIVDIAKVSVDDLPQIERKTKKRWHPDRVAHIKDPEISREYTEKFQQVELAINLVRAYLTGAYHAGDAFTENVNVNNKEPEEIIRENAGDMQQKLRNLWSLIKEHKYKQEIHEVVLSDGFKLKDLLREDFKEDIAMLSVVSFFYGSITVGILIMIGSLISPVLGGGLTVFGFLQVISCFLGVLPLSRFWMHETVEKVVLWFINFGLSVYSWAVVESSKAAWWVQLLVLIPNLFAVLIKYVILFPLYEIAKAIVGDKVVGVVKESVSYYAGIADWYFEDLVAKKPAEMTGEELFHLSHVYSELGDVRSQV